MTGNPVELADRRDVSFAVRPVEPFGDVEDEVGPGGVQPLREVLIGLQPDDLAQRGKRALDPIDRLGLIPLRVEIGLIELGMQSAARVTGILGGGGESLGSAGGGKRRLEIVG